MARSANKNLIIRKKVSEKKYAQGVVVKTALFLLKIDKLPTCVCSINATERLPVWSVDKCQ